MAMATQQNRRARAVVRVIENGVAERSIEAKIDEELERLEEARLYARLAASVNWRA